ncbi:MAG: DEAD/DEAH box helicase family protein [Candidatus Acidiferrales bacterium]
MQQNVTILIPPKLYLTKKVARNRILQLKFPEALQSKEALQTAAESSSPITVWGKKVSVSKGAPAHLPAGVDDALVLSDAELSWAKHIESRNPKWAEIVGRRDTAISGLRKKFKFIEEEQNPDHSVKTPGLRPPQIGAIYSALGHLRMTSEVGTIVLPTGTGKTDSMVGLLALLEPKCLLVVVPTDALREQLAEKFMRFGVLAKFGILPGDVTFPVVGVVKSRFESKTEMKVFCNACNVVVTTMPLLSTFEDAWQKELAIHCSHLFIDEAHHVRAVTWSRLRSHFGENPCLQFTATPYRNDGQHVDGRIIFNYPLVRAQQEGYFNKIVLRELWEPVDSDEAVAKTALTQLKADLVQGLDHIVMARTAQITKAEELKKIYDQLGMEYSPVVVHSKLKRADLNARMTQLRERKSRIAICVSMFGEGFDFPELKIAALHDIHQSLAVTIQFAGRFTRSNPKVGDATVIVNRADNQVNDSVRELYAQGEGADWNRVLRKLTEGATTEQIEKEEFFDSFNAIAAAVPIQNVTPKMSTVVYQTQQKWNPWGIEALPQAKHLQGELSVSLKEGLAYFVTLTSSAVAWAQAEQFVDRKYDLFAIYWDEATKLLYVNSSDNSSVHEGLAKVVGGDDAQLITGIQAFRVLDGINRLTLRNMGLNDRLRRSVRFMMYTGSDIKSYLENSDTHGKEKTHVFGDGFNGASRVTVGTSKKGRIWSWKEAKDLLDWKAWCRGVGAKLLDSTIKPDAFLEDSMIPEDISETPDLYPLFIEWPDELYRRPEESIFVENGKTSAPFFNVGIDLVDPAPKAPIQFVVHTEQFSGTYKLTFVGGKAIYLREEGDELSLRIGKKTAIRLSDFMKDAHPVIRYEKDCFSRGDQLMRPRKSRNYPFDQAEIVVWNWDGVDPKKESQTTAKIGDSIQRRTLDAASRPDWIPRYEILFDDDDSGEAADVVGIARANGALNIDFFHCKYSKSVGGKRIKDLYEVCGQAQRSRKWRDDVDRLFAHLGNREKSRLKKTGVSRFEKGNYKLLETIRYDARSLVPEFRAFIVQPGLSKATVTPDQCEVLGTAKLYLNETIGMKFTAIGAA